MSLKDVKINISSQAGIEKRDRKTISYLAGADNTVFVPIWKKAAPKSATVVSANSERNSSSRTTTRSYQTSDSQTKTNQDLSISSDRAEPLVIFGIKTTDLKGSPYSPVSAAVTQAYLEDRISQAFAARIFDLVRVADEKAFDKTEASIKQQIQDAQNSIDQIRRIFVLLNNANTALLPTDKASRPSIAAIARQTADALCKPEPLLVNQPMPTDPYTLIEKHCVSSSRVNLKEKTRTALMTQALQFALLTLYNGCTPEIFGEKMVTVPTSRRPYRGQHTIHQSHVGIASTLKTLSMKKNPGQNYLLGYDNENAYPGLPFYKGLSEVPAHKRSLALVTMLANEYALSAGLGRLSGTPLGSRFGSDSLAGGGYVDTYLGARLVGNASRETTVRGSLLDYLVVSDGSGGADAGNARDAGHRLLLFDSHGYNRGWDSNIKNSFDVFLRSIARDPTNNKVKFFDDAVVRTDTAFSEGLEFYKKLHLRDKKPKLLTPRGLYTRMLEELAGSLEQFGVNNGAGNTLDIMEVSVFKVISEMGKTDASPHSKVNGVKRYLLSLLSRKALLKLADRDFSPLGGDKSASNPSQKSTATKIEVTNAAGKTETTTVKTTPLAAEENSPENIKFGTDVIRFSSNDGDLISKKMGNKGTDRARFGLAAMAGDWFPRVNTDQGQKKDFASLDVRDFFEQIYDSDASLLSKIVQVYLDIHDETKKLAQSENGDATFLTPARLTRNSQIDGSLSLSMLLETMLDLVSMFVDASTTPNDATDDAKYVYKHEIWYDMDAAFPKISVMAYVGEESRAGIAARALRLLANGSKSDNFDSLVNDKNLIPDLDLKPLSTIITANSYPGSKLSFLSLQDNFTDLAKERDIPLAALTSVSALISHTYQQTRNLSDVAEMLRGENPSPSDLAKSLMTFAQKPLGKDYLASVSDYSLDISQRRLDKYKGSLVSSSRRLPKITAGEVACIVQALKVVSSTPSDNIVFCTVGLPSDYFSRELLPTFRLASGYDADVMESVTTVQIGRKEIFGNSDYKPLTRNFFALNVVDSSSFSGFENNPPTSLEDIVLRATLAGGITGKKFIEKYSSRPAVRDVLTAEINSYLMRKAFSVLSSADLFEESLVEIDYEKRSAGSAALAQKICAAAGFPTSTFDNVFVKSKDATRLSELEILNAASPKVKKIAGGQTFEPPKVNVSTAELFYDIFDSIYFYNGLIEERIFSPSYFEKTMGFYFYPPEFKSMSDREETRVMGGRKISTNNQLDWGLARSDVTQGTVSIDAYSVNVVPGPPLVVK